MGAYFFDDTLLHRPVIILFQYFLQSQNELSETWFGGLLFENSAVPLRLLALWKERGGKSSEHRVRLSPLSFLIVIAQAPMWAPFYPPKALLLLWHALVP